MAVRQNAPSRNPRYQCGRRHAERAARHLSFGADSTHPGQRFRFSRASRASGLRRRSPGPTSACGSPTRPARSPDGARRPPPCEAHRCWPAGRACSEIRRGAALQSCQPGRASVCCSRPTGIQAEQQACAPAHCATRTRALAAGARNRRVRSRTADPAPSCIAEGVAPALSRRLTRSIVSPGAGCGRGGFADHTKRITVARPGKCDRAGRPAIAAGPQ